MATNAAPQLLKDLRLRLVRSDALSIYESVASEERVVSNSRVVVLRDLATVTDRDNLAQAITIRLLTPRGELTALGHPEYGSRLPDLIGRPNSETQRNLAKLYVIEALKQERRISKLVRVDVLPHPGERHLIRILIEVLPIGTDVALALSPLDLDLGI